MCSEFWDGWFDSWGEHHHTTPAAASAADLDVLLAAGGSVNIYMFHGGTNFGFTNGANDKGVYRPIATSYDYDAPLDEAGRPTAKFHAFRSVIARYAPVPPLPASMEPGGSGRLASDAASGDGLEARLTPATDLAVRLDRVRRSAHLLPTLTTWSAHESRRPSTPSGPRAASSLYRDRGRPARRRRADRRRPRSATAAIVSASTVSSSASWSVSTTTVRSLCRR